MSSHGFLGLSLRIKQAGADDQADVLRAVRRKLFDDPPWIAGFNAMLGVGAFESAAFLLIDHALPGVWWFTAKGKSRPDEPLYGAQLMFGDQVLAQGEHDASLALALVAAAVAALENLQQPATPAEASA